MVPTHHLILHPQLFLLHPILPFSHRLQSYQVLGCWAADAFQVYYCTSGKSGPSLLPPASSSSRSFPSFFHHLPPFLIPITLLFPVRAAASPYPTKCNV